MAEIHHTTLSPSKVELLTQWLPQQPWYVGAGSPSLTKAGGFRLDDPAGEVGMEFMVVADDAADEVVYYQVPVTYRSGPLDGAEAGLIGTAEHGVLGRRWVYDGLADPVLTTQLRGLVDGTAEPQAQSISHTPEPKVVPHPPASDFVAPILVRVLAADDGATPSHGHVSSVWQAPDGTELRGTIAFASEIV